MAFLRCTGCDGVFDADRPLHTCPECDSLLEVRYGELPALDLSDPSPESVWRYRDHLPVEPLVTLDEGGTPLYSAEGLAEWVGLENLHVKHEGMNPTGSFKDRGMTVGVSKALQLGVPRIACASTGNTSAAMAAYGARAGVDSYVLLPAGKVALGKVSQALIHGARVVAVRGNFDDALRLVREVCSSDEMYLLNSVNPFRLEGQKTVAFESVSELGKAPDRFVFPVGNAGNISAAFKGLREWLDLGMIEELPRMTGVQTEGARPLVDAYESGADDVTPETDPETLATAIRIGNPVNGRRALQAIRESGGTALAVTDDETVEAQRKLASLEGIGAEPASAASVAGLKKMVERGVVETDETVVCVATGNLLKDPEEAVEVSPAPVETAAELGAVKHAVGL
ncbi:MAG: Threonine synthase [Methanonatronarchaeales archaeon]|nr:Threonine synthase [Methanonatronarchaeales archaeon]